MSERKDIPANPDATEGHTAADQLHGGCETCDGMGVVVTWAVPCDLVNCPSCHGTGDPQ